MDPCNYHPTIMLSIIIVVVLFNQCVYSETCKYKSKTCTFEALIVKNGVSIFDMNITLDDTWHIITSTLYCGTNDCERELHVTLGESVSWTKGNEFSEQESVSKAIINGVSTGEVKTVSANGGLSIEPFGIGISLGGELGMEFHKSTTNEFSLESSFSSGRSVTYSLAKEHSLNREEAVICSAKANEGVKLLARTNELQIEAFVCIPDGIVHEEETKHKFSANCDYVKMVMRPFSGNSISADIKCSTDDSIPHKNSCSAFDETCDLNKRCCSNLECVKSDPTWLLGRCYNTNKPNSQNSNNNCIPFDGVCSRGDTCCGNTYCYYGNPSWANGRCYNKNN